MKAQKLKKQDPQALQVLMDRLLMENIGKLAQLTEQKKTQAQSQRDKKDFAKLVLQQLERGVPGRASLREIYSLRLQKWIDVLKEKFLYAKSAPFHWLSSACLVLLFFYIGFDFSPLPFLKQKDISLKQRSEDAGKLSQKSSIKQGSSSTLKASSFSSIPSAAARKGNSGKLDSKEEELLLALETAESKIEKLSVLKKLKSHYLLKNKKKEANKIQGKLEKLRETP